MIAKEDLAEVLQVAVKNGDFAEIYIEKSSQNRVSMEAGKIERVISGRDEGAGIRVIKGDNTAYGYTTDLTKEGLMELARQVAGGLGEPGREAKAGEKAALSIVFEQRESPVSLPVEQRPDEVSIDQKVALVLEAERAARAKDEKLIRQVSVGYADTIQQVVIANSDGVYVEDERVRSRLVVHVVASDGKVIQTGYESAGGTKGFELFAEEKAADLGRRAAERALLMLKARPAPAGRMPVVISGEAGGTMIHEACGHGLEADLVQKNLSVYAGRKGEKVASELVTVIDDGTIPGKYGSSALMMRELSRSAMCSLRKVSCAITCMTGSPPKKMVLNQQAMAGGRVFAIGRYPACPPPIWHQVMTHLRRSSERPKRVCLSAVWGAGR